MKKHQLQEKICQLYLRLNGFLTNSLIIHSPENNRSTRTDIDIIAVAFPKHKQADRGFNRDPKLEISENAIEFIIGEVKGRNEKLKFNESVRNNNSDEIITKLFHWIGVFDHEEIPQIVDDFKSQIKTKANYDISERFDKYYETEFGIIRIRPLLFGIDRFRYRTNQLWHLNGKIIIDFLWQCFIEKENRRNCQLHYDYSLWGEEFAPIVKYIKTSPKKPTNFNELYNNLLNKQQ